MFYYFVGYVEGDGGGESLTYTIGGVKQMGCLMGDSTHKISCAMTHLPGIEASLRFITN